MFSPKKKVARKVFSVIPAISGNVSHHDFADEAQRGESPFRVSEPLRGRSRPAGCAPLSPAPGNLPWWVALSIGTLTGGTRGESGGEKVHSLPQAGLLAGVPEGTHLPPPDLRSLSSQKLTQLLRQNQVPRIRKESIPKASWLSDPSAK